MSELDDILKFDEPNNSFINLEEAIDVRLKDARGRVLYPVASKLKDIDVVEKLQELENRIYQLEKETF